MANDLVVEDEKPEENAACCIECGDAGLDLNRLGYCETCAREAAEEAHGDYLFDRARDEKYENSQ